MKRDYLTIPEMAAMSMGTVCGLRFRVVELEAERISAVAAIRDGEERLEDAIYALKRLSTGAVFADPDEAISWARGIAVSALDEIER